MMETWADARSTHTTRREEIKVVVGACAGTVLEWYDFFLYGSLAIFFSSHFFPAGSATAGYLASLATFGAGFIIRPLGAVLFGWFGDKAGRKATFLVTIILMGISTAGIGILPSFQSIGWASPITLVVLRMLQGLALGGEYGGAATYIAEHSRADRRGFTTGFLQTTATLGFLLSLGVTLFCQAFLTPEDFSSWGWRIPFLASLILLAMSTYLRTTLSESPVFAKMKAEHRLSASPLKESFLVWRNVRSMLVVLFGAQAAVGLVWYMCNFYTLYFLTQTLKVPTSQAYGFIAAMLLFSLPLYVFFGWLSDKIGRKVVILTGCALAVLTLLPIFTQLSNATNPELVAFQKTVPIRLAAGNCSAGLFSTPVSACDRARDYLTQAGLSYQVEPGSPDGSLLTYFGDFALPFYDADAEAERGSPSGVRELQELVAAHDALLIATPEYNGGYPALLKNAIDWVSRPRLDGSPGTTLLLGKVAALASASPGQLGGLRAQMGMRTVLEKLGILVIPQSFALSAAHEAFNDEGLIKDANVEKLLKDIGATLVHMASRLK